MIEEGADLIKDFKNTPEEQRPWAREIIYIIICIAICMTTFFVFQAQKSEAVQRAVKAEAKLEALQQLYVNEGKECPKLIQDAVEKRDLYWSAKFDNLQETYNKDLKSRADKWESQIGYLTKETRKVKDQAKQITNKIER